MVLLDTGTPGTSREIYSEVADGETRTRNPWITKTPINEKSAHLRGSFLTFVRICSTAKFLNSITFELIKEFAQRRAVIPSFCSVEVMLRGLH